MNERDWILIIFIFIITLALGSFCLKFFPSFPIISDAMIYDDIALNLIEKRGFTLEGNPVAEAPGYPIFLAFVYFLFGHNYQIVRIIQFLLLAGMGAIVYFIARKFLNFSRILAFLTSLTIIIWPYFVLYSTLILTEILFIFFLLVSVSLFLEFSTTPSFKNALLTGFFFGLANLFRPVIVLLPFWMVFFFLIFGKKRGKNFSLSKIFLLLVIFLLMLAPWTIRNYFQFHKLIIYPGLTSVLKGIYLTPDYTTKSPIPKPQKINFEMLVLTKLKDIYLFWNPGGGGERTRILIGKYSWSNYLLLIYKILFFSILGLAFFSLKFLKNESILLFWIIIFYFWALHIILFPYPRYTLPIIPLVILLAFYTINYLSSRYKPKYISR